MLINLIIKRNQPPFLIAIIKNILSPHHKIIYHPLYPPILWQCCQLPHQWIRDTFTPQQCPRYLPRNRTVRVCISSNFSSNYSLPQTKILLRNDQVIKFGNLDGQFYPVASFVVDGIALAVMIAQSNVVDHKGLAHAGLQLLQKVAESLLRVHGPFYRKSQVGFLVDADFLTSIRYFRFQVFLVLISKIGKYRQAYQ